MQKSTFLVIALLVGPCTPTSNLLMAALNRNGILVPPEQLATNAQAQEYVVVAWNAVLYTDTPQMCLKLADQEAFRGRRVIVAGYYGNDYLTGQRQIKALQQFDDYGVLTSFANVSVSPWPAIASFSK